MDNRGKVRIGTCSWKYDSWEGIVYSRRDSGNLLCSIANGIPLSRSINGSWSLFDKDVPILPRTDTVREYADSVPPSF